MSTLEAENDVQEQNHEHTIHPCSPCSSYTDQDMLKSSSSRELSDSSSNFGDEECGELERPQHLLLDFTPGVEDDDFMQEKVCAFWEFLKSNPELFADELTAASDTEEIEQEQVVEKPKEILEPKEPRAIDRSAISSLKIAGDNHVLDNIFDAEVCRSMCSLGCREYIEKEPTTAQLKVFKQSESGDGTGRSSYAVQAMCKDLHVWTLEHPKSMDPPGHISDSGI